MAELQKVSPCKRLALQTRVAPCKLMDMPELPDIVAYITALGPRIVGQRLERVRLGSPFLLRTVGPPLSESEGRVVEKLCRLGKRIAIGLEGDLWLLLHLMIAGRLHWKKLAPRLADVRIWRPLILETARSF